MAIKRRHNEEKEEWFLSPTIDLLFKRIFADTRSTKPICSLLGAILNTDVSDVCIENPELPRSAIDLKGSILDIHAILNGTVHVNIEMQVYHQADFIKRAQLHVAKMCSSQLAPGDSYNKLQQTIVINILCDGNYGLPAEKWHNKFSFKEEETNAPLPNGIMEMHFIELKKALKLGINDESDLLTKWVLFMSAESMNEMKAVAKEDPAILEAYTIIEEVALNKKERMLYEARQTFLRDQLANKEEGREEEKRKIAKKMLSEGIDIETICKVTGLQPSDLV